MSQTEPSEVSTTPPTMMGYVVACFLEYAARADNKKLLQERLLNPVIQHLASRLWPYILGVTLYLTVVTLLLVFICYCSLRASRH